MATKIKRDVSDRKGILGGSSLGAALGFSTYQSPLEVAEVFLGKEKEVDEETQERFDMAHELEDFVASQIERVYGLKVQRSNFAYVHPRDSRIFCHPDRVSVGKIADKKIGVEIKTSSVYDNRWGTPDTDQIPFDYLIQCQLYMDCEICDEVWLFRFSNNKLSRYIIKHEKELMETLITQAIEWMDKVTAGWLPAPITYKEATSIFDKDTSGDIYATEEIYKVWAEWKALQGEKKKLEDQEDQLKIKIVSYIGDKKVLLDEKTGDKLCTYSKVTSNRLDSKRLKEERPDVFKEYSKTSSFMTLR